MLNQQHQSLSLYLLWNSLDNLAFLLFWAYFTGTVLGQNEEKPLHTQSWVHREKAKHEYQQAYMKDNHFHTSLISMRVIFPN